MTTDNKRTEGPPVYDPRGAVEAPNLFPAERRSPLAGVRLAVLDNTKWNANRLLRGLRDRLAAEIPFGAVTYYKKESFSLNAADGLIDEIVGANDVVLTAIGD